MFCVCLAFLPRIVMKNTLVHLRINSQVATLGNEVDQWSVAHAASFQSNIPSNNLVYCSHLPNLVSARWVWRISPGIGANEKRQNNLN